MSCIRFAFSRYKAFLQEGLSTHPLIHGSIGPSVTLLLFGLLGATIGLVPALYPKRFFLMWSIKLP